MNYRIKQKSLAYYHCMSRIVGREMLLGELEKEHMRKLMRRIEGFTGVRVLTYAIMTNHVHVLLEEPDRDEVVSDEEFERRMAFLYSEEEMDELKERWAIWLADGCVDAVRADKERYLVRMHDISEFMKQLKQRFSRWYNRMHDRTGALWDRRFKSVLVEAGRPMRTVAAYIEMNPVRAGLSQEPQEYRFCGFGEAMGGGQAARRGIMTVAASMCVDETGWMGVSSHYLERILMYEEVREHPEDANTNHDHLREKLKNRQVLTEHERLLCRCRYFTDGRILGGKEFVDQYFSENAASFGAKRKTGARKVKGGWHSLFALRELVDW
ncbi:MAG: chemotaxis protein CheW [Spartobacteria bacterium]|nr:chemotaxis protein CheW [Spartobacteria bacterium]